MKIECKVVRFTKSTEFDSIWHPRLQLQKDEFVGKYFATRHLNVATLAEINPFAAFEKSNARKKSRPARPAKTMLREPTAHTVKTFRHHMLVI